MQFAHTVLTSAYRKQASDGRHRRCNDEGKTATTVHARLSTNTALDIMSAAATGSLSLYHRHMIAT